MKEFVKGKMRKGVFIDEYGMMTVVYIANILKNKTIDDIVSNCTCLQVIKYPNCNYCLVPANEDVNLEMEIEEDTTNLDILAKEIHHNDTSSQTNWRRVEGYTVQNYYMDNPDIFDGEIM